MSVFGLVDRFLARLLRGGTGAIATLDLHGLGVREAIAATEQFLRDAARARVPAVRIVYGKGHGSPAGRGILREVIPRWLGAEGRRWVASATPETDRYGEDGAIRVQLLLPPVGPSDA